jgi:UPF0042 nucleotide-binding protein
VEELMKIVIVTGMSGAGKSTALNMLEDEGYYCVDNMPISLIPKFAELADCQEQDNGYNNIALGVDIRSGHSLAEFESVLDYMKKRQYNYKILFLESSDEVLVKRYKETRRTHPLAKDGRVDRGIELERKQLKFLKQRADYIVDTSTLLTRELKQELQKIILERKEYNNLFVTVLSFGFKYGIPACSLPGNCEKNWKRSSYRMPDIKTCMLQFFLSALNTEYRKMQTWYLMCVSFQIHIMMNTYGLLQVRCRQYGTM